MKVHLNDIRENQDYELKFDENVDWVSDLVRSLDEQAHDVIRPKGWKPKARPIQVEIRIRRIDDLFEVDGHIQTGVNLLCSLCAEGFHFPIQTRFRVLYTQDPKYLGYVKNGKSGDSEVYRVFGKQGVFDESATLENTDDFEVEVLEQPFIDLAAILNEQILLMIPMQPRPEQDENEKCRKCGLTPKELGLSTDEDLQEERSPFAGLKNLFQKKGDPIQ
jgi:uncharacterized metal-binding protein YceD (DUF177 family)